MNSLLHPHYPNVWNSLSHSDTVLTHCVQRWMQSTIKDHNIFSGIKTRKRSLNISELKPSLFDVASQEVSLEQFFQQTPAL